MCGLVYGLGDILAIRISLPPALLTLTFLIGNSRVHIPPPPPASSWRRGGRVLAKQAKGRREGLRSRGRSQLTARRGAKRRELEWAWVLCRVRSPRKRMVVVAAAAQGHIDMTTRAAHSFQRFLPSSANADGGIFFILGLRPQLGGRRIPVEFGTRNRCPIQFQGGAKRVFSPFPLWRTRGAIIAV